MGGCSARADLGAAAHACPLALLVPLQADCGSAGARWAGPWYSREAWWNLFPLGWGDTNQSPDEGLWMAQVDHVAALFWAIVDALDPDRIVILAGKGYWDAMASAMGLADLPRMERPLIAGGVRDCRAIVWTYHPGGHLSGVSRHSFAAAIADSMRQLRPAENL